MSNFRFRVDETSDLIKRGKHKVKKHPKKHQCGLWSDSCGACREPETSAPVALGSSPELSAFTMSLAPPVHPSPIFLTDTENL